MANDRIYQHALIDPAAAGMGTVVTALLVDEAVGTIAIGHVGDSRAYRLRDGVLEQLTPDHSLVGELVRAGRLSTEEAEQHPHRSVITRAVGTEPVVDVETLTVVAAPGDLYLICSDGLTDIVRDGQIAEVIAAADHDPDAAAEALVAAANAAGGIDNITVVLFEIVAGEPSPLPEPPAEPEPLEPDDDTMEQALEEPEVVRRSARAAPWRRPRRPLAGPGGDRAHASSSRRSSSGGASPGERPQQGAPQPRLCSARRVRSVRERLDRRHRSRLRPLARLRRRHLRSLPRGARGRAVHGSRTPIRRCCHSSAS